MKYRILSGLSGLLVFTWFNFSALQSIVIGLLLLELALALLSFFGIFLRTLVTFQRVDLKSERSKRLMLIFMITVLRIGGLCLFLESLSRAEEGLGGVSLLAQITAALYVASFMPILHKRQQGSY